MVEEQLETSRTRAEAAKLAFRQLKVQMIDNLRLRVERCSVVSLSGKFKR